MHDTRSQKTLKISFQNMVVKMHGTSDVHIGITQKNDIQKSVTEKIKAQKLQIIQFKKSNIKTHR